MKLAEIFQTPVPETAKKTAASVVVALSSVFSAGCANLNLPEGNIGGIPVGRVINQSVNRDVYNGVTVPFGNALKGAVRFTTCVDQNGSVIGVVQGDPSQCDQQVQQRQQQNQRGAPVGRLPER